MSKELYEEKRNKLVQDSIKPLDVDEEITSAFLQIPRHEFVPDDLKNSSYEDIALPIGEGQTISQPSLVALMTNLLGLKKSDKVLEVGTGSGYQAAILSKLVKEVFTIERIKDLADRAEKTLKKLGCQNVHVFEGDGSLGLTKFAPYDGIIVTAGARGVPKPLSDQLVQGGRIVIPVGKDIWNQKLMVGEKQNGRLELSEVESVRFVPLIGEHGWRD
ncbi:MAG: protein-L-isoaspartate(D-aspartate) O-methyltransferase [Candidatus Woykebacteria bacterium]